MMCLRELPASNGAGPTGAKHLVAMMKRSRLPRSQRPMISSVRPRLARSPPSGYASEESRKSTPASAARSMIAIAVASSLCSPKVIVPRHSRDTCRPLRPSLTCSMIRTLTGGRAGGHARPPKSSRADFLLTGEGGAGAGPYLGPADVGFLSFLVASLVSVPRVGDTGPASAGIGLLGMAPHGHGTVGEHHRGRRAMTVRPGVRRRRGRRHGRLLGGADPGHDRRTIAEHPRPAPRLRPAAVNRNGLQGERPGHLDEQRGEQDVGALKIG